MGQFDRKHEERENIDFSEEKRANSHGKEDKSLFRYGVRYPVHWDRIEMSIQTQ